MASHKVVLSSKKQGILGIVGHAGCGHCNSHLGFIQDDSGGLTAVMALLTEATGLSLEIESVKTVTGMDGFFEVKTKCYIRQETENIRLFLNDIVKCFVIRSY